MIESVIFRRNLLDFNSCELGTRAVMRMGKGIVCAISLGGFQALRSSAKTAPRGSSEQRQREEDGKSWGPRTAGVCVKAGG